MNQYLGQHADIFIPADKDKRFFGRDLTMISRLTEGEFLARFEGATSRYCLDSTVYSLLSKTAAEEIQLFAPSARIIIMLRNPVEMLHAHHAQLRFNGLGEDEDIPQFEDAWHAEEARRGGRMIPEGTRVREALYYRELGDYAPQVARYLAAFGADNVHVVVFDDFVADPQAVTRDVFDFLGVSRDVPINTPVVNPNTVVRFALIRWLLKRVPVALKELFSTGIRRRFRHHVGRINTKRSRRPDLGEDFVRELTAYFEPKTVSLEDVLGRPVPWSSSIT